MSGSQISHIALVGPPNAGKTTLYNWLTGSKYRTVNYPGATVEYAVGELLSVYGRPIQAVDTPGLYSLSPKSPEEEVTVNALFDQNHPDAIVVIVDATQLSRHLPLVEQIKQAGFPFVVAVTMLDLLKERGGSLDLEKLSQEVGGPVVAIDGRLGGGVKDLVDAISKLRKVLGVPSRIHWTNAQIEKSLKTAKRVSENVAEFDPTKKAKHDDRDRTSRLDRWLLHPVWGLLAFTVMMSAIFMSIFWAAQPAMDLVDASFGILADWAWNLAPGTLWSGFLSKGLIAGLGSVLVFVPQIFILFLGLGFLEDWGYLARAAALVDKPFHKLGLNGRSFVPLLSGYACAIPAMMAARTISNRKERLLTIFIIPLMSCSARLPVYALLLTFVFHGKPAWMGGLAMTAIYLGSLLFGAVGSVVASRFLKIDEKSWFMMELPVYRTPKLRTVMVSAFRRTLSYVQRAGPTILGLALIIWAGTTFPDYSNTNEAERLQKSYFSTAGHFLEPVMEPMGGDWRVGVSLLSAFAAREVFVSSMALIFSLSDIEDDSLQETLLSAMKDAKHPDGTELFTPASIAALVIFFMISLQCLTTVAVSRREAGSWKFAMVQLIAFTLAGYLGAVGIYQFFRHLV